MQRRDSLHLQVIGTVLLAFVSPTFAESIPFKIRVIDKQTRRGVPLVELETVHHLRYVTDNEGTAHVTQQELMGQDVFFHVNSHGYTYPKDGFGYRGKSLRVRAGDVVELLVDRQNIAERLYRITGPALRYRQSHDQTDGRNAHGAPNSIVGCDSVLAAPYRDKLYWFWGDTSQLRHPLAANFHTTGATSLLPNAKTVIPSEKIQFNYFLDERNNPRPMAKLAGEGPTWISALTVLRDKQGEERLYANFVKIRNGLQAYRWGFVRWNDQTHRFDEIKSFSEKPPAFPASQVHTFHHQDKAGTKFIYFAAPFPLTRVRASTDQFLSPEAYEHFTCLSADSTQERPIVVRESQGKTEYTWRKGVIPLTDPVKSQLIRTGQLNAEESFVSLRDIETGRKLTPHNGSTYWNHYRRRWIALFTERGGKASHLGEIWFSEADAPEGPWRYARQILTHDNYSFYNPKHHPFFDEQDGRVVYFEGTYTHTFSKAKFPTPLYDYNQIMYRLDLADPRLALPVPIYEQSSNTNRIPFVVRGAGPVAFFAYDSPAPNTVPVVWEEGLLKVRSGEDKDALFYALPVSNAVTKMHVPLYEYIQERTGRRQYSAEAIGELPGFRRAEKALCLVWRGPSTNAQFRP